MIKLKRTPISLCLSQKAVRKNVVQKIYRKSKKNNHCQKLDLNDFFEVFGLIESRWFLEENNY